MIRELSQNQKYHFVQFHFDWWEFLPKKGQGQILAAQDSFNPDFGAFDSAPSSGGERLKLWEAPS